MNPNHLNPYESTQSQPISSKASSQIPGLQSSQRKAVDKNDPASLHRGLGALIGSVYGGFLVAVFAFLLLAVSIKTGLLRWVGVHAIYPEIGLLFLPICALPGGVLGGLLCGSTRGRRLKLALGFAAVPPLLFLIAGFVNSVNLDEIVFGGVIMLLASFASTLICAWIVFSIKRRRRRTLESLQDDTDASPGIAGAVFNSASAVGTAIAVVFIFNSMGPGTNFFAGLTTGVALIGLLSSLHLLAAYPNRCFVGTVTTVVHSAVCFIMFSSYITGIT